MQPHKVCYNRRTGIDGMVPIMVEQAKTKSNGAGRDELNPSVVRPHDGFVSESNQDRSKAPDSNRAEPALDRAIDKRTPGLPLQEPSIPFWASAAASIMRTLQLLGRLTYQREPGSLDEVELLPWLPGVTYGQFKAASRNRGEE